MAKIPFDIKYRPQIENGEYKVVTENNEPARIICWDSTINKERPIIAIVFDDQIEQYKADGRYDNDYDTSNYDLFIVTPEEELNEIGKRLVKFYNDSNRLPHDEDGVYNRRDLDKLLHNTAAELLSLAREELFASDSVLKEYAQVSRKQGEAKALKEIEQDPESSYAFKRGCEYGKEEAIQARAKELSEGLNQSKLDKDSIPYHLIEFMCNLYTCKNWKEIEKTAEAYVTRIKAAALKDLPRWKEYATAGMQKRELSLTLYSGVYEVSDLFIDRGLYIPISELQKLPGFKEDEK